MKYTEYIRIGLMGSSCSGKTTTARLLSRELNLELEEEIESELLSRWISEGRIKDKNNLYPLLSKEFQEEALCVREHNSMKIRSGISDRTAAELLVYNKIYVQPYFLIDYSLNFTNRCKKIMDTYTHLFLFPQGVLPLEDNRFRTINPNYQKKIHQLLSQVLKNIVIIGWGQIAELLCEHEDVVGFVKGDNLEEIIDVNTKLVIEKINPDFHLGVIGIGKNKYKEVRSNQWLEKGYRLGVLIHPTSYVSPKARIGEGSVIMPLAFIDDKSIVGRCSIIGPQSALRVATIGDYCHLTIQTKILPNAKIEDYAFIGSGAVVLENKKVGMSAVVGANATVYFDIPPEHLYIERSKDYKLEKIKKDYPLTHEEKEKNWNRQND